MNTFKLAAVALFACASLASPRLLRAADAAAAAPTAEPATPPATAPSAGGDQQPADVPRFYGSITAIDADAKTFTVGDQTFNVVADSKLSKSDDSPATLADAKVGEPARGTYNKAADGKLNVIKVRFGKKTGGKSGGKSGGKKKTEGATTEPAAQ
jgi:hypothetical protein